MNNTLRILREQNNYSQAAVAAYLGISRQMYIKYENGAAVPPVKIVTELSNFYRVPYDVIIEDKLNQNENSEKHESGEYSYERSEDITLELHDPDVIYGSQESTPSYYLKAILDMLPKLVYKEQLKVMEKLAGMVQKATEERLKPNKQLHSSFYEELNRLNEKYHPNSHGAKWTREELYER